VYRPSRPGSRCVPSTYTTANQIQTRTPLFIPFFCSKHILNGLAKIVKVSLPLFRSDCQTLPHLKSKQSDSAKKVGKRLVSVGNLMERRETYSRHVLVAASDTKNKPLLPSPCNLLCSSHDVGRKTGWRHDETIDYKKNLARIEAQNTTR
jgi:hypothetical protein